MEIIKRSKDSGKTRFECPYCGTEFIARRGEYSQEFDTVTENSECKKMFMGLISTGIYLQKVIPIFRVRVKCPSCKENIYRNIPAGEPHTIEVAEL